MVLINISIVTNADVLYKIFSMKSTPDHLIVVTGFGEKGIPELAASLRNANPSLEINTLPGCPPSKANVHPQDLVESLAADFAMAPYDFTLLGHSYGALLALAAACRRRMCGISNLILVDGPLHPDVEVRPPEGGFFDRFTIQYENRVDTAHRCLAVLRELPPQTRRRIVTIGNIEDAIVPPDAKCLSEISHHDFENPDLQGHSLSPPKIEALTHFLVMRVMQPHDRVRESRVSPAY